MNNPNRFPRPLNPAEYNQQLQQYFFHQHASAMAYHNFLQFQAINSFPRFPYPNFNYIPVNAILPPPPPLLPSPQLQQQQQPQQPTNQGNRRGQNIQRNNSNRSQQQHVQTSREIVAAVPPLQQVPPPLLVPLPAPLQVPTSFASSTSANTAENLEQMQVPTSSSTVTFSTPAVENFEQIPEEMPQLQNQTPQEEPPDEPSSSIQHNLKPKERKNYAEEKRIEFVDLTLTSDDDEMPSSTSGLEACGSRTTTDDAIDADKNKSIIDDDINFVFSDFSDDDEEEVVKPKFHTKLEKEKTAADNRKKRELKRHSFFRQNRCVAEEDQPEPADDDDYQPESEEDESSASSSTSSSSSSAYSSSSSSNSSSEYEEEEETRSRKSRADIRAVPSTPSKTKRATLKRNPSNYFPFYKVDSERKFGYGINTKGKEKGRIWLETEANQNKIHIFKYFDKRSDAKRYVCNSCSQAGKHTILEVKADPNGIEFFMEDLEHVGDNCAVEWKNFQSKQEQFQRNLAKKKNNEENFPPPGTRLVPEGDYEFGYNRYRIRGSRIIVREETNRNLAREYNIYSPYAGCEKEIYRCVGCVKEKYVAACVRKSKDGKKHEVAVPFNWKHLPSCKPKPWKEIQETQRRIKQKLKKIETKKGANLKKSRKRRIIETSDSESGNESSEDEENVSDNVENSSDDSMDKLVILVSSQDNDKEDNAKESDNASPASLLPSIPPSPTTIILNPKVYEFAMNKTVLIIRDIQDSNLCRVFSAVIDLSSTSQKYECKTCLPLYKFVITVAKKGATVELRQAENDVHHEKCLPQSYQDVISRHRMIKTIQEEDIDTYKLATYSNAEEEISHEAKDEVSVDSDKEEDIETSKTSFPIKTFQHPKSIDAAGSEKQRKQPMRHCKKTEKDQRRRSLRKRKRS